MDETGTMTAERPGDTAVDRADGTTANPRRLVTVEEIAEITPIPDADSIVRARVRGWDVVVKAGEFSAGDRCIYFEVDSMLDVTDTRFAFLEERGCKTDATDRQGHVLRTVRLRGQYSQGLALPLSSFPELVEEGLTEVGTDVTDRLGVWKWEPPVPAQLTGTVAGPWPGWIPHTDAERVQNLPGILDTATAVRWIATEKIDGTSMTVAVDGSDDLVCSRNLNLLEADDNTLWTVARRLDLHARLRASRLGPQVALQGELWGESIQGNPFRRKGQTFSTFDLVVDGRPIPRDAWPAWVTDLSVPVLDLPFPVSVDDALTEVDGLRSALADRPAEGVVWCAADTPNVHLPDGQIERARFKAISNRYLLKHDR